MYLQVTADDSEGADVMRCVPDTSGGDRESSVTSDRQSSATYNIAS